MIYESDNRYLLDFECSHNNKILNRNGGDWYELIPSFTIDELFLMRDFLYCHPIDTKYDFNDIDDISNLVYDYIQWWVFDLIQEGECGLAKTVLNEAFL